MTTTRTHSAAWALAALGTSFVLLISAFSFASVARAGSSQEGCVGAYGWPVKPFGQAHPVRGNFGDPRTRYDSPRSDETLLEGDGALSFHQGLDINAPDGSPVYAVASGRVVRARGRRVTVVCGNGRSFQYWHIYEAVRVGQHVDAGKTVVGFILPKREHVHLTHLENGRPVNPLVPGNLTPYRDTTSPSVLGISIRRDEESQDEDPDTARGPVVFVAEAVDTPALPVEGRWQGGFPVTPAQVMWRIERGGCVVVPQRVAWNVRGSVPRNDRFFDAFARGTYQNWPVFGSEKFRFEKGKYLFRLSVRPFDSRRLRDGEYDLVVTAADTAGNRDEQRLRFTVANH
jgi:murein DD-endopeptidase MepM/ murein hydrolase activator NlpD